MAGRPRTSGKCRRARSRYSAMPSNLPAPSSTSSTSSPGRGTRGVNGQVERMNRTIKDVTSHPRRA
jgi:hypothetical protein